MGGWRGLVGMRRGRGRVMVLEEIHENQSFFEC